MPAVRIVRGTGSPDIQRAHDSLPGPDSRGLPQKDDETCKSFYNADMPPIDIETALHDRAEYKQFTINETPARPKHRVLCCCLCGHMVREDQVDSHDRLHRMGARIL